MRYTVTIMIISALAVMFAIGCGNKCKEAADHQIACVEEFCGSHADYPLCQEAQLNTWRETVAAAGEVDCVEALATLAETQIGQECSALLPTIGFVEIPAAPAAPAP